MNCNQITINTSEIIPRGNDFYLQVNLFKKIDSATTEPFDLTVCDEYDAIITKPQSEKALAHAIGLAEGTINGIIIDAKGLTNGEYIITTIGKLNGRSFRCAERGVIGVTEFNSDSNITWNLIEGENSNVVNMTFQLVQQTVVVGKNAYELAKEEGYVGSLQDFIEEMVDAGQSAAAARAAAESAMTAMEDTIEATNNAIQATLEAQTATNNAIDATNNAINATMSANTATTAARQATANANTATTAANTAIANANSATTKANNAAAAAEQATNNTIIATTAANIATANANAAAAATNNAIANATAATQSAITATENANTATTAANIATANANTATANANAAISNVNAAIANANEATISANTAAQAAEATDVEIQANEAIRQENEQHREEIMNGYDDRLSDVEENKADKNGSYDNLLAGSSKNLYGENSIPNESIYRPTGGKEDVGEGIIQIGSGLAQVKSLQGNTINWNQLVPNGNFEDNSGWTAKNSTKFHVANNVGIFYRNKQGTAGSTIQLTNVNVNSAHTYYLTAEACVDTTITTDGYIAIGFMSNTSTPSTSGNEFEYTQNTTFTKISLITSPVSDSHRLSLRIGVASTAAGVMAFVKNVMMFDLTLIYNNIGVPTTPEKFEADYERWFGKPLTYENYNEGELIPNNSIDYKTIGFNQYNPSTGLIKTFINKQYQITGIYTKLWESDEESVTFSEYTYGNEVGINRRYTINNTYYFAAKNVVTFDDSRVYLTDSYCLYEGNVYKCNTITTIDEAFDVNQWDLIADVAAMISDGIFTTMEITPNANGKFTPSKYYLHVEGGNSTDTCVHLVWSGKKDGVYEEYKENTYHFDITTLTGKLNGTDESVVVFPDGMEKARNVYDEIKVENGVVKAIKRVDRVDLGNITWGKSSDKFVGTIRSCQNVNTVQAGNLLTIKYPIDAYKNLSDKTMSTRSLSQAGGVIVRDSSYSDIETFAASLQGVMLYYERATYLTYILDDFELPINIQVDDFGTEEQVTSGAPAVLNINYSINAVDFIRNSNKNFISETSMDNFLNQLGVAMGGTWVKQYNETLKEYEFSFTPNEPIDEG